MTEKLISIPKEVADIIDELTKKYKNVYGDIDIDVYAVSDVGKFILFSTNGDPLCSVTFIGHDVWTSYYEPQIMIQ